MATDGDVLAHPVWYSLRGPHRDRASVATGPGDEVLALRYPREVSPFAALADVRSEDCWLALASLIGPDETVALIVSSSAPFTPPPGWKLRMQMDALQMVLRAPAPEPDGGSDAIDLGREDAAEMLALAELTRPGPFGPGTGSFGGYVGVRDRGRLIAMAGRRLHPPGHVEVSAVCTHPDHRGRGLSRRLVGEVTRRIVADGDRPFLHVRAQNAAAIRLYESMGFETVRRPGVLSLALQT